MRSSLALATDSAMVGQVAQSLVVAIGIAIFPVPIIVAVLILLGPRAQNNIFAFIGGWLFGIGLVGVLSLAFIDPFEKPAQGERPAWVDWLILALGCLLIYFAIQKLIKRFHQKDSHESPKWMSKIAAFSAWQSVGAGIALSALNPKNIPLIVGAVAEMAEAGLSISQQAVAMAIFAMIATLGIAVPVGIYFVGGDGASAMLDQLKHWMERNSRVIVAGLFLVIGLLLVGHAVTSLST